MRYLILSDIHANLTALNAVLNAARGRWEKAVCLGDLVGYGPDPNEVIDRVRALPAVTIRGNHDKAISGLANPEEFNPVARDAVLWTRAQLRPENLDYLQKLPGGPVRVDAFSIVHGSVYDEDEYVFSPALAIDGLLSAPTPVVFFGHTHIQGGFTLRGEDVQVVAFKPEGGSRFAALTVKEDTQYLLNPGSIGQPRDGDTRAGFAIADLDNQSVEFWRVPYDIEDVQRRMARAGLPEPLILRLTIGH
ncbi:MAG TPA: metallophosphoesterase family protein [Candidatus Acidoferrales bacterium]|nr:metallophosphoesterase family protein [Candidatus Acidoferrales bacterium]